MRQRSEPILDLAKGLNATLTHSRPKAEDPVHSWIGRRFCLGRTNRQRRANYNIEPNLHWQVRNCTVSCTAGRVFGRISLTTRRLFPEKNNLNAYSPTTDCKAEQRWLLPVVLVACQPPAPKLPADHGTCWNYSVRMLRAESQAIIDGHVEHSPGPQTPASTGFIG